MLKRNRYREREQVKAVECTKGRRYIKREFTVKYNMATSFMHFLNFPSTVLLIECTLYLPLYNTLINNFVYFRKPLCYFNLALSVPCRCSVHFVFAACNRMLHIRNVVHVVGTYVGKSRLSALKAGKTNLI